jgi:SRSO17 transposase
MGVDRHHQPDSLGPGTTPPARSQVTFFYCHAPHGATLATLVRIAGGRWPVETCFQAAKSILGIDAHQVRLWRLLAIAASTATTTVKLFHLHWSGWRRRHQVRWHHWRTPPAQIRDP